MMTRRHLLAIAAVLLVSAPPARAEFRDGIGVLGDSYSDEYQFYPPDRSTARNWVEILAATRGLDFGPFSAGDRGEPRNRGFAYNWSRSDATTDSLLAQGQHTGLAAQVARGEVKLVVIFIGGNDFIAALKAPDPSSAVREVLPRALANFRVATETILRASTEVKVVLATVPDIRYLPEFEGPLRSGHLPRASVDAVSEAIRAYNAQMKAIAANDNRLAVVDLYLVAKVTSLVYPDWIDVAGRRIDRRTLGNDVDHFFLEDSRHSGTVGQGLLANQIIGTINARFGAGVKSLDERELVEFASAIAHPAPSVADRKAAATRP